MAELRVGQGSDTHRLVSGRALVIGGVSIPFDRGADAHSDGDVLLHAATDAILGALSLGDIGGWFPNTDPRWRGVSSSTFVTTVLEKATAMGWRVVNIDSTIIAEAPKLAPFIAQIRESVSAMLSIPVECCSVKANTAEKMGALGRGEGIQASCIVLLSKGS